MKILRILAALRLMAADTAGFASWTAADIQSHAKAGANHKMAPGDVFHIPSNVPHQMLVPKSLVIQVMKVDSTSTGQASTP
jgi:uncharacterized RmlC-like cupin family protein